MSVLFVSVNVRGLKNIVKRKTIFLFCKEQKANCIFLQETHSGATDEELWKRQWGDKILFSHGTSHSAGVMILFNRLPGTIIEHKNEENGHWLMLAVEIHEQRFILTCVYGFNQTKNRALGILINEWKIKFATEEVIIGGDFNIAPNSWMERIPHKRAISCM